jgi:acyl-homoserine lactone acylase PvdQ
MINDQHSDYAALLTPFILRISKKEKELSQAGKNAFITLKGWNYDMNRDLVAPTVFEFFK